MKSNCIPVAPYPLPAHESALLMCVCCFALLLLLPRWAPMYIAHRMAFPIYDLARMGYMMRLYNGALHGTCVLLADLCGMVPKPSLPAPCWGARAAVEPQLQEKQQRRQEQQEQEQQGQE